MNRKNIIESFLLVLVLVSIVAVPFFILKINNYYHSFKFSKGAQVITLYGIAKEGIWTEEPVTSFNYWWKKFKRAEEIPVRDDGTPIIFRVTSTDVLHSFAIPLLRVDPYEVKAGQFVEIELKTNGRLQSTEFFCYQYCGQNHYDMYGMLVVLSPAE